MPFTRSPAKAGLFFFSAVRAGAAIYALPAFCLCLFISSCAACGIDPGARGISVVSYNAMALFDGTDSGREYSGYSVAKGEWGPELYGKRLDNLRTALEACAPGGPDIACLVEIENGGVLADLRARMKKSSYAYSGFAGGDTATGCGIVSRFPIAALRTHLPSAGASAAPLRPILEAQIDLSGAKLFIFVNHWKSKLEGDEETETRREESARLLSSLMADRAAAYPDAILLACGDLNEGPDEWEKGLRSYPTALGTLRMDQGIFTYSPPCGAPLILCDGTPAALSAAAAPGGSPGRKAMVLASPWLFPGQEGEASYVWKGEGERIDHFLLSAGLFDGSGWEYGGFKVIKDEALLDGDGNPLPWDTRKRAGFSDHLPIRLSLKSID